MDNYSFLGAANTAFFEEIYQQYLKEPDSVESSWRSFFQGYDFAVCCTDAAKECKSCHILS